MLKVNIVLACIAIGISTSSYGAEYKLKMQTFMPPGSATYKVFEDFVKDVELMSGGRVSITPLPEGAVVANNQLLDAVGRGILDAEFGSIGYNAGKDPAFGVLGNFVAGYDTPQQLEAFYEVGGGNELAAKLFKQYNVCFIGAAFWQPESIPSRVPIRNVDDFKGKKIRAPEGTVAKTFSKLGASVVTLPGSEVFDALSNGVIDALDYTTLGQNVQVGLHPTAKYALYPFSHSMPALDISFNCKKWNAMPADLQAIVRSATRTLSNNLIRVTYLEDKDAAKKVTSEGVTLISWDAAEEERLRKTAFTVMEDYARGSSIGEQAIEANETFMRRLGLLAE